MKSKLARLTGAGAVLVVVATTMALSGLLVLNADRGLDFTDESYYILWAAYPDVPVGSATKFGHITNLVFELAGGSLAGFRILGVLLLLIAAYILSRSFVDCIEKVLNKSMSMSDRLMFSCSAMSAVFAYYWQWLTTPSYNWLALFGLMLTVAGLLRHNYSAETSSHKRQVCLLLVMSVCTVLVAYAKVTTGAALFLVVVVSLLIGDKTRNWRAPVAYSFLTCVAGVFISMGTEGSLARSYQTAITGINMSFVLWPEMSGTAGAVRLLESLWTVLGPSLLSICTVSIIATPIIFSRWFDRLDFKWDKNLTRVVILQFSWLVDLLLSRPLLRWDRGEVLLVSLIVQVVWCLVFLFREAKPQAARTTATRMLMIFGVLYAATYAYAFGTGVSVLRRMSEAAIFPTLIVIAAIWASERLIAEKHRLFSGFTAALLGLWTLGIVVGGYMRPYRLPAPISQQTEYVHISGLSDHVRVDKTTAAYVEQIQQAAESNNFESGDYLIDLTGKSPGVNLILDARFAGAVWLLGGYPGSVTHAEEYLRQGGMTASQNPWVLTAVVLKSDKIDRSISSSFLGNIGINFPAGYRQVGEFQLPLEPTEAHQLWKPASPITDGSETLKQF